MQARPHINLHTRPVCASQATRHDPGAALTQRGLLAPVLRAGPAQRRWLPGTNFNIERSGLDTLSKTKEQRGTI